MATKLEKLFFAIGVQDGNASSKIAKLNKSIENLTKRAQGHLKGVGIAGAGVAAAALSVKALVAPAVELNRALSEAEHAGASAEGLQLVQKAAGSLAVGYGISANEVIRSSAGMQRAMDDLTARELASFTSTSNLLAKAGRTSVENTTSYIGAMYGIFEANAQRMGKSRWAEQMAGQTDFVAKTFNAKSEELAASFAALGNKGVKAGIEAGEQMAVLAVLQRTMSGAEAGTKYAAFLEGATRAQRNLGISFKDSQGNMLGMTGILDKIKAKYGDTLTEAQQAKFAKAFGDADAGKTINTLLKQSDKLGKAVADVRKVTNLTGVRASARKNTDAFERWGATVSLLRANFTQKMLPTIEKWTNKATDNLEILNKWITKYPNVARVIGYVVLAIVSAAGVVALVTMGFHLWKLTSLAVVPVFKKMTAAMKLLSGAMRANPVGVLITLFIAFIFYGNEISGMLSGLWSGLKGFFAGIPVIGEPMVALMDKLEERWNALTALFTDFTWTKLLKAVISTALSPLEVFINSIGSILDKVGIEAGKDMKNWKASDFADSLLGADPKTAMPGAASLPAAAAGAPAAVVSLEQSADNRPQAQSLQQARTANVKAGGILATSSSKTTNTGKTMTVGEQHIHIENPPSDINELMAMVMG